MQVKTFTGTSTQDVLASVKAELGPDAIILGSREFRKDGQRLFEITAGIERTEAPTPGASADGTGRPPGWDEWHDEWSRLKDHIYALMQPAIQWEKLSPRQRVALEYLQKEGVEDDVVVELYRALQESHPGESMLAALAKQVPVRGFSPHDWPQRLHVMAGPFGGGKTSSALRLGLSLRATVPGIAVAYLNADCTRGNGRLVLRHWAELSDFGYYETPDAAAMKAALRACHNFDVIFIDLQGLAQGEHLEDRLMSLGLPLTRQGAGEAGKSVAGGIGGLAVHLAMPPHYSSKQLSALLRRYQTHLPTGLVWTKLDEAVSFGNVVNVGVRSGLPITALSYGSELNGSLSPADEGGVWRMLLKRQLPGHTQNGSAAFTSRES